MNHTIVKEYGDFVDGDLCEIKGERGAFTFKYVAVRDGEVEWVSVHGPTGTEQRMWRSFTPDRLKPLSGKRRKTHSNRVTAEKQEKLAAQREAGPTPATIRHWASRNGIECPSRGRIPNAVREAYAVAAGSTPEKVPVEPPGPSHPKADPKAVRAWAIENGIEVSARGRIAGEIVAKYLLSVGA